MGDGEKCGNEGCKSDSKGNEEVDQAFVLEMREEMFKVR
jgi:hypothetical protein